VCSLLKQLSFDLFYSHILVWVRSTQAS